jgi:hypothetical protein
MMCRPPLVPDAAEQGTVACQVDGGADGPALHGVAGPAPGTPERLVSRSLPNGEDERIGQGPHQLTITVVVLIRRTGGGCSG